LAALLFAAFVPTAQRASVVGLVAEFLRANLQDASRRPNVIRLADMNGLSVAASA
jgi:hypothetical protein